MGFLARSVVGSRPGRPSGDFKTTDQLLEAFKEVFGTNSSMSGEKVNIETALQVATVLACTRVVANGISQVPLKLFRETANAGREPAKDHPLYWVLFRKPNPWQSSFDYRQMLGIHLVLAGNHYSYKNIVNGKVVELLPFNPRCMEVKQLSDGSPKYTYRPIDGPAQVIPTDRVWHVKGMSWNGWVGLEPVKLARDAIGLSISVERQQADMFKNGMQVSGTYAVDGKLNAQQYKQLRDWIVAQTTGENAGMPLILDNGAKWLQRSMSGIDAQQLETRRNQVEEICRALGVFPQMVGYTDKTATFASAESFFIAHVVHTLSPIYECIEQSIAISLLTDAEMKGGLYAKFIEEGLLRGSMTETANMLDKYVNGGLMTPNEGRAKLDMNPDSDPASDKLRVPANIVGKQPPTPKEPPPADPATS